MPVKKVFPYFGSKFYLVDDILSIINYAYKNLGITCVVDVFGGSGTVLFAIPDEWKIKLIYNDLDKYLYNIFKVLQDDNLRQKLIEKWHYSFPHSEIYREFRDELFKDENFDFEVPNVDIAFKWLYIVRYGVSGKATRDSSLLLIYSLKDKPVNFDEDVMNKIKRWQITNKDYRDLIKNANRPYVFLYLDPPYLKGGHNYNIGGWTIEDYKKLKELLDDFSGYWLMNESSIDEISEVFGEPKIVKEFANHSYISNGKTEKSRRKEGFWTNFEIPAFILEAIKQNKSNEIKKGLANESLTKFFENGQKR